MRNQSVDRAKRLRGNYARFGRLAEYVERYRKPLHCRIFVNPNSMDSVPSETLHNGEKPGVWLGHGWAFSIRYRSSERVGNTSLQITPYRLLHKL